MAWHEFHFIRPWWWLAVLPLAYISWRLWQNNQRSSAWQTQCDPHLLPQLLVINSQSSTRLPVVLLMAAWLLTCIALTGPTWTKLPVPVFQQQSAHVVILNLGNTMNVPDLAPSRLTRAKYKLIDLLKRLTEAQTALVVYAGDAHVVSPLTDDANTIATQVPMLQTDIMPVAGNNLSAALTTAQQLLTQAGQSTGDILLISDSPADHASLQLAKRYQHQGYRLSVLGVGTATGAPIPTAQGGFEKDRHGNIVVNALAAESLKALAAAGGGSYQHFTDNDQDLNNLLAQADQGSPALQAVTDRELDVYQDEGHWLILPILVLAATAFRRHWVEGI